MKLFCKFKTGITPFIFVFSATVLFFYRLFIYYKEMMFPGYDILGIFYYEKLFFLKSIITFHQIPLWNPFVFSGTPFLANPTASVFYPTTLLFLIFPTPNLFGFLFCIDILLSGIFTYIYCRSIKLGIFSSLISSLSFMFSGILITLFIPGHLVVLDTIIWFPLLLFLVNKIIKKQKFPTIALLGIVISLTIFAGHTQLSFYSLSFVSFYLLFMLLFNIFSSHAFKPSLKIVVSFLLSALIGLGISAIQLFPSLEFASLSSRAMGVSFEFASSFSIHPYQLLTIIFPHFFGDNLIFWGKANFPASSIYIGITPLFFVPFSFMKKNKYILFFVLLSIFTFIYATGEHMQLFTILYSVFPGLNSFRVPSRTLYFFVFSLSILAGLGVQNFLDIALLNFTSLRKSALKMAAGVIFLFAMVVLVYLSPNSFKLYEQLILRNSYAVGVNHFYIFNLFKSDLLVLLFITASITSTLLLLTLKKINPETFKIILIFLTISDLFIFGQIFIQTKNPADIFKMNNEKKIILEDRSIYRVFDMEGAFQGLENIIISNVTGVHSLYLKSLENFVYKIGPHFNQNYESFFLFSNIDNPEILRLFNVKYVIAHKKLNTNYLKLLLVENNTYMYELTNTYPRAFFSTTKNLQGYFTPENTSSIQITNFTPNEIEVKANTKSSGRIVLSEIIYPGWKAYVDSKETHIENVNNIFRSVKVSMGKHKIKFVYDPLSFKLGALVSGFTIILTILGFLFSKAKSN